LDSGHCFWSWLESFYFLASGKSIDLAATCQLQPRSSIAVFWAAATIVVAGGEGERRAGAGSDGQIAPQTISAHWKQTAS